VTVPTYPSVSIPPNLQRWAPYDNDGLALVLLGRVLVGSGCDDLGQADRYSSVSNVSHSEGARSSYAGG
jgi:hypothetical protein